MLWRQFQVYTANSICCYLLHLGDDLSLKIISLLRELTVEISLEFRIRQFISRLVLSIVRSVFLHSIIGKVHLSIEGENIKFIRGCSDIAFVVPIPSHNPEHISDQHIVSNVEFSIVIQQRPIYIQLHDKGFISTVIMFLFLGQHVINLVDFVNHCNTITTVG